MALGGDQSGELMMVLKFSTAVEMTSPMVRELRQTTELYSVTGTLCLLHIE